MEEDQPGDYSDIGDDWSDPEESPLYISRETLEKVEHECHFDEIPAFLEGLESGKIGKIKVLPGIAEENKNKQITLANPAEITFDPSHVLEVKLRITNTFITLTNMNLHGDIYCTHSCVNMNKCKISGKGVNPDYIVLAERKSRCNFHECIFEDGDGDGIGVIEESHCVIVKSTIRNCVRCCGVTIRAALKLQECEISTSGSDLLIIDTASLVDVMKCVFSKAKYASIAIYEHAQCSIIESKFMDNGNGAITVRDATIVRIVNCEIMRMKDTAILLECGSALVSGVVVDDCNGNGVNAQRGSTAVIQNSHFKGCRWPSLAICDKSIGYVKDVVMEDCGMSGFVVRGVSKLDMKDCIVKGCAEHGMRISDSTDVTIERCVVMDCQLDVCDVYDQGSAKFVDCWFGNARQSVFNCFTGGSCECIGTSIIGPFSELLRVHYGGSAHLTNIVVDPTVKGALPVETFQMLGIQNKLRPLLDKSKPVVLVTDKDKRDVHPLFKIDTQWSTVATNCFIIGSGWLEVMHNVDKHRPEVIDISNRELGECKVCKKPANMLFSPCGHNLYCNTCWASLENKPKDCELCYIPIDAHCCAVNCGEDEKICAICYTDPCDTVFLPCGHIVCRQCALEWMKTSRECPFCREQSHILRRLSSYK